MKKIKCFGSSVLVFVFSVFIFAKELFADVYFPDQPRNYRKELTVHDEKTITQYVFVGVGIVFMIAVSTWVLVMIRSKNANNN